MCVLCCMHIFLRTYPSQPPSVNMQWFGVEQTLYRHTHNTGHLHFHAFLHALLLHARIARHSVATPTDLVFFFHPWFFHVWVPLLCVNTYTRMRPSAIPNNYVWRATRQPDRTKKKGRINYIRTKWSRWKAGHWDCWGRGGFRGRCEDVAKRRVSATMYTWQFVH